MTKLHQKHVILLIFCFSALAPSDIEGTCRISPKNDTETWGSNFQMVSARPILIKIIPSVELFCNSVDD